MEARRFPEPEVVGSIPTAGDLLSALDTWALSSVEERPFRIREVEGSNPSVSTLWAAKRSRQDSNLQPLDPRSNALPLSHATWACIIKFRHRELNPGLLGESQVF